MRFSSLYLLPVLGGLCACSSPDLDRTTFSMPAAIRQEITFEPLTREQAQRYLEQERQTYKQYTDPMIEREGALQRGRDERYRQVRHEFPECEREKHCIGDVSHTDIKSLERLNELTKEINAYDKEILEIDAAVRDWKARLDLRTRAILNRFLVHEVLELQMIEPRLQAVLVHSLQSFETRRQTSLNLMRFASTEVEPRFLGDYDFRMLGRPIDEAAVIASFEVYLSTPRSDFKQPTRYVVTMLVNTHQLDLRFYDRDFLRVWADQFVEPYQPKLKKEVYCGVYSIAGDTLAPRLDPARPRQCADQRSVMRNLDAANFHDRFPPDRWMLPIAYYPMPVGQ